MDTALTDLSKVVDFSSNQLNEMAESAIGLGKQLGKSSVEIMQGMAEFGRITKDQNEIIELSRVATMASNVTTMTSAEAAKAITTSMITFGIEAKDSMRILNSLNEVQNNFKVSAEDMVASISKIGAASRLANTDMEDLEGMTAAIVQSLGISGNEAGTAIKSFMSRIYRTDESNPDELGKTAKALKEIMDIDTSDANGNLKSFNDLISEIKSGWSEMSKQEQLAVAQSMGSTYHYSKFIALLENYQIKLDAAAKARNSENSALDENAKKLDSLSGRLGLLKVAGEEFSASIINSNALKEMVSSATSLVGIFTKITSTIGGIPTILATAVIALSLFKKQWTALSFTNVGVSGASIGVGSGIFSELTKNLMNFKTRYASVMAENIRINNSLSASLAGVRASTNTVQVGYTALTGRTIAQTIATVGATAATVAFNAALTVGLSLLIMGAVTAFSNLTQKTEKAKEEFENLTMSISQLKKETTELPSLISSYEKLYDKLGKTTEEKEELANATARLSSLFGDSVIQLDSEGKVIQVDIEYVKQLTQAKKDLLITQQQELSSKFNSMGKDQYDEILEKQNRIKEINAEISEKNSKVTNLQNYNDSNPDDFISAKVNNKFIKDYQESIAELATERTKLSGESNEIQKTLSQEAYAFDQSTESSNKLSQSLINNLSKATFDSGKGFNDLLSVMGVFSKLDVSEVFKRISEDMTKVTTTEKATEDIKDMESALKKHGVEADIATKIIKYFNDAIKLDNAPKATNSIKGIAISSKDLADSLKDVTSLATDVSKAMEEYNETGKLSASTIVDLVTKYPQLIDQLKVENGQLTLNKEAVQSLLQVRIDGMITSLQESIKFTEVEAENTKVRINNLILEAEAIERRNSAYNSGLPSFFKPTVDLTNVDATGGIPYANREEQLKSEAEARLKAEADILQKQIDADNATKDKIASMKALLGNIKSAAYSGSYPSAQKDKKEPSSSLAEQVDIEESLIRSFQTQANMTAEAGKLLEKQIANAKSAKDLNKELSLTNDLIKNQSLEISQRNEAKSKIEAEFAKVSTQSGFQNTSQFIDPQGEATLEYQNLWNASSVETQKQLSATFDKLSKLQKAWMDTKSSINSVTESQKQLQQSLQSLQSSQADEAIALLKQYYENQKKLDDEAYEKKMKKLDSAHQKVLDNLDKEEKAYEDSINAQIDAIDKLKSAEDYNKSLNSAQSEVQTLQSEKDSLSLDTSTEGRARVAELQKQIDEKNSSINDMQADHTIELRKQNLQDQLDEIKKVLEAKKNAENESYNATKTRYEADKKSADETYNTMMANDQYFADKKKEIIDKNITDIQTSLKKFSDGYTEDLTTSANKIDKEFKKIIKTIAQIKKASDSIPEIPANASGTKSHPGGLASFDEEGRELLILPSGKQILGDNSGAKIANLPIGTEILNHNETESLLSKAKLLNIPSYANGTGNTPLMDLIKNIQLPSFNMPSFQMPKFINNNSSGTNVTIPNINFNVTSVDGKISNKELERAADFTIRKIERAQIIRGR